MTRNAYQPYDLSRAIALSKTLARMSRIRDLAKCGQLTRSSVEWLYANTNLHQSDIEGLSKEDAYKNIMISMEFDFRSFFQSIIDAIVNFFKAIIDRIRNFFTNNYDANAVSVIDRALLSNNPLPVQPVINKLKVRKFFSVQGLSQYNKDAHVFNALETNLFREVNALTTVFTDCFEKVAAGTLKEDDMYERMNSYSRLSFAVKDTNGNPLPTDLVKSNVYQNFDGYIRMQLDRASEDSETISRLQDYLSDSAAIQQANLPSFVADVLDLTGDTDTRRQHAMYFVGCSDLHELGFNSRMSFKTMYDVWTRDTETAAKTWGDHSKKALAEVDRIRKYPSTHATTAMTFNSFLIGIVNLLNLMQIVDILGARIFRDPMQTVVANMLTVVTGK